MDKKIRILIVDDDEVDRELLKKSLKALDAEIIETATGLACLEVLKAEKFNLILLDYKLPDTTGLELVTGIKKLTAAPIVIVTGFGNEDLVVAAAEVGVLDYIPKNKITPEFLTRAILNDLLIHKTQIDKIEMEKELLAHKDVLSEIIKLAKDRLAYYDKLEEK